MSRSKIFRFARVSDTSEAAVAADDGVQGAGVVVENLEQRIMYSADVLGLPLIDTTPESEILTADNQLPAQDLSPLTDSATASSVISHSAEIVFVDSTTPENESILADLVAQQNAGRSLQVVMISSGDDGIGVITDTLASFTNVSAVHVISHGNDTGLALGNSWLDLSSAKQNSERISQWQNALTGDADLLLYGCNLAASEQGIDLLNSLSTFSKADVAASNNSTGHAFFQGDWTLEHSVGTIEAEIALSPAFQGSWSNELALDLLAVDDDFGEVLSGNSTVLNDAINAPGTNILGNDQTSASTVQLLNVSDPSAGTISNNNGVFTYVPASGYTGNDSFDYVISDTTQPIAHHFPLNTSTTADSISGNETVTVAPQNQPTLNGSELEFDGDDYIEIPDIDYPKQFTLSLNFKVGDITNGKIETLFQHGFEATDNSIVAYISGQYLIVSITDSTGDDLPDLNPPTIDISAFSNTDDWQTLTITHSEHPASGPTGETEIEVFVNGVNQDAYEPGWINIGSFSVNIQPRGGDPIDPTGNIFIGKYQNPDGTSDHYLEDHQIQDVRIYDEIISPSAANQTIDYSTGTVSLDLRNPNQPPVFASLDDNPLYIEDQPSVVIDTDVTISDAEHTADNDFNGSTLTLQRVGGTNTEDTFSNSGNLNPLVEGQALSYNDPVTGNTTMGVVTTNSGGLLELTFTSPSSNELVNSVLQAISYSNSNNTPPASVDIDWNFNDGFSGSAEFGTSLSASAITTIDIEETPDFNISAPTSQINTDEDISYLLSNDIAISHDQDTAASFSIVLSADHGALSLTALPGITINGNNTGSLSLSGPVDDLNQTLQSVSYNPDADFNGTDKLVITGAFDSKPTTSISVSTDIQVNSVNDIPVISNANNLVTYDATTSVPVLIDPDISIGDSELSASGNYLNTSITLVRENASGTASGASDSANPEDNFTAPTQALNLLEGSDLVDGNVYGFVQKNSGGELQLVFNANADKTKINNLLQSIHYNSNSPWPPAGGDWPSNMVELQWSFDDNGNDENGSTGLLTAQTGTALSIIDITTPGFPPQEITNENFLINTGSSTQVIDPTLLEYIDPDSGSSEIVYTITNINNSAGTLEKNGTSIGLNGTFSQQDIDQGRLTYTPTATNPITTTISFDIAGASLNSDSGTFTIVTIDDGPNTLQSGIRLNLDGGNDAFLGGTGDAEYMNTLEGWTREFTFSELSITGNTEATLYSTSGGTTFDGHYDYLAVLPDGTIEWYNKTLETGGNPEQASADAPMLSANAPGILDGGLHTIAVTQDVKNGGVVQLFYDGVLMDTASNNLPFDVRWVGGYPWVIGQQLLPSSTLSSPTSFDNYDFVSGAHFSGVMHESRFWNEIRTQNEIQDSQTARLQYNSTLTQNLAGNWHMHDPNGDETVASVVNLAPGEPGQTTTSTLVVGHATGAGFTSSTPTDELEIDDTASDGTVVGYVTPIDPVPDVAGYEYYILPNSLPSAFSIDSATGEVVVSDSSLLSETASHYDLVIRVVSTDVSGVTHTEDITLRINAINEPPTLTLTATTPLSYTEGDVPVILDSGITITDDELEATSFGGSTLTLERYDAAAGTTNTNPNDAFSSDLFNSATTIFSQSQSNGKLVVSFDSGATATDVGNVLQSIKYQNISDDPISDVQLLWLFNDGNVSLQGAGGALEARAVSEIQITPVNDIPVLENYASPFTNVVEDTPVAITFNDLRTVATDVDGTVKGFEIFNIGSGSLVVGDTFATASPNTSIDSTKTIYWTPPADSNGLHSAFQVLAVDDLGAASDSPRLIHIQVDSVSDYPEGSDHNIDLFEDSSRELSLNDFGFSDKDGDAFSSVNISAVTGGSVWVSGTELSIPAVVGTDKITAGAVSYKPQQDQHSHTAEIIFEVVDSGVNNTDQISNVLSFDVASVNDAPAAQDKKITVQEDTPVNLQASDFGFTDTTDISALKTSGDNPYVIIFDSIPSHGVLKFNNIQLDDGDEVHYSSLNGTLIYEPEPDNHTDTWIDFRVSDNGGVINGGQDTSPTANRIDLPITSVNDHPSGQDQFFNVLEGATHTFTATDFGFTDIADSNNLLGIKLHTLPAAGFLALSGTAITTPNTVSKADIDNGLLTYIPPTDTQGTVDTTFSYYVQDDGGTADNGIDTDPNFSIATISNQGVNDPPVVDTNNAVAVTEDTPYKFNSVDFGFFDQENHNLQGVEIVSLPSQGILSLDDAPVTTPLLISAADLNSEKLVYTPDLNHTGTPADSFHFKVQDDGGVENGGTDTALASQPMSINVDNTSDNPTATNFDIDVVEENFHRFTLAEFGFLDDAENDGFKALHIKSLPAAGTLTLSDSDLTGPAVILTADIESGLFKYLPPDTENDQDTSFEFKVQDTGNDGLNTSHLRYTVSINNIDVNDPPVNTGGGAATIEEDTSYTFQSGDFAYTDIENHSLLNIVIDSLPSFGSLSKAGTNISNTTSIGITDINDGHLVYTPATDSTAADTFFYRVQDDGGTEQGGIDTSPTSKPFTINVNPINDPPAASDFSIDVTEDNTHTFFASQFGFTDGSDQHLFNALLIQSLPVDGNLLLDNNPISTPEMISVQDIDNGLLQYIPPEHTQGNVDTTFTFTVQDNGGQPNGGIDTAPGSYTATITNYGVNDPPSAHSNSATAREDTPYNFDLADFGFDDPEDHQLQHVIIDSLPVFGALSHNGSPFAAGSSITATDINAGLLSYITENNANGLSADTFYYRVQDDGDILNGGYDTALTSQPFTINIDPVNDHPTAADFGFSVTEDSPHTFYTSQFGFTDVDDQHTFKTLVIQSLPADGQLLLDGNPIASPALISVPHIDNGLFQYIPPDHTQGNVDTTFTFTVQDSGGQLNGGLDTAPGSYTSTITNLGVNDPPKAHSNNTANAFEDTAYDFNPVDFEFDDPEGNQLQNVLIDSLPAFGSLSHNGILLTAGSLIPAADISAGLLSYSPADGLTGLAADTFYYRVQDNGGTLNGGNDTALSSQPLTIDLFNVNDPPTGSDSNINVLEDTPYQFSSLDFPYSDIEDDALKEIVIHTTSAGRLEVNGTVVSAGTAISVDDITNGDFHYTPPANLNGASADTLAYYLRDAGGTQNNGQDTSVENYLISIDIASINDPPQGSDAVLTTFEDTPASLGREHFRFSDTDDDNIAAVQFVSVPQTGQLALNGAPVTANSTVAIAEIDAGNLAFIPAPNTHGLNYANMSFQLIDDGVSRGANTDNTANVISVNVVSVSDAPIALSSNIQLLEDTNHTFTLNDFQFTDLNDAPYENSLSGIEVLAAPMRGNLTLNDQPVAASDIIPAQDIDAGRLQFSPTPDSHGDQYTTLKFRTIDNGSTEHGGINISTASAESSFSVAAVNDSPLALSDEVTTTESLAFDSADSAFNLMDNDTDVDTDAVLAVSLLIPPSHGQLQLNADGSFVYEHDGSETTEDEFTYQLSDGLSTDEAKVRLSILPLNDAPTSQPLDAYSLNENQSFQLQLPDLIFSDPDLNDELNITLGTSDSSALPEWITFNLDTMQISGTPVVAGSFVFTLTATDTSNASTETKLYLTVVAEPELAEANTATSLDESIASPDSQVTAIGEGSGLAITGSSSLANANLITVRSEPDVSDPAEDIHTLIEIPEVPSTDEILVFAANKVNAHPERIITTQEIDVVKLNPVQTLVPLSELFNINENQFSSSIGNLGRQLEGNSESMSSGTEINLKVATTTIGVSTGLSIGYIVWLLRGGLLLGSVLSSLPAWRSLDPLPVLATMGDGDDDSDDESLEELVNANNNTEQQIEDQKVDDPVDVTKDR